MSDIVQNLNRIEGRKIFISGMHSGQNPSAGVGIAKSLRKAFPDLHIVGVDHWQGSSGLHDQAVDEVLLFPQWKQIDFRQHAEKIRSLLDEGHLWISALDIEIYWLAQNFGTHPNLLAPSGKALELTAKPMVSAFQSLNFLVPDYISAFASDLQIHSFLRKNSWQCWLKGPYHEAKRVSSWDQFLKGRESLQKSWKTSRLFLQKHIAGNEESICFSAHQGKLLSCVQMQKRILTSEGKTWAGKVQPVSNEFYEKFKAIVRRLDWSGGGEIEFTRDLDGQCWIIECNPRFPAWIYGAALVGFNLPGKLFSDVLDRSFEEQKAVYPCFTRVVKEIPAKEDIGLPLPADPSLAVWTHDGQKGKSGPNPSTFMPDLRDRMDEEPHDLREEISERTIHYPSNKQDVPVAYANEIQQKLRNFQDETPFRMPLEEWTLSRFESLKTQVKCAQHSPEIRLAYSVKTSATDHHLKCAQKFGFLTECISQLEIERAMKLGIPSQEIILNGPGKFWPRTREPQENLYMLFCDSLEEFDRVIEMQNPARILGFRIQLPNLTSRFGVSLDKIENFQGLVARVKRVRKKTELGFHFHMPSWAIGMARWKEAFRSFLTWTQVIEQLSSVPVRHLDFGGGFFPSDLEKINFRWLQESVKKSLPQVESLYFEPGRSITQEGEILISRVLDIRKTPTQKISEIVVDACIAELPLIHSYSHRIFCHRSDSSEGLLHLDPGETKVLGRICMENDVLSPGLKVPESLKLGDLIVFGDAGAYERSMSYDFGRG
jgi:diaminopimelate decarboxylase